MNQYRFDVIVIGAGPAGVTAAGALARAGISVALHEAGVYAGAENWSGCVYFAESLAEEDCFGREAVEAAPFERRAHRRGTLMHNSLDIVGAELSDPDTFKNCYIVLRPVYDPYFAMLARNKGAVHLTGTTVTSLVRRKGRVVGVQTNRGSLYADVVFIAEGDASHLVKAERLERVKQPHYLQGVKAVLSLSPDEIEKRFNLKPGEGAAYEILLRNPSIAGRTARLNIGGFLYTNRDSLSLGYAVPLNTIRDHYRGDHERLFEWMKGLPYLRELVQDAPLSAYGTKIIRSGGWHERPVLVEEGLAVGGASAGLGIDVPYPNFTGPASATGLYFARAVKELLKQGKPLDTANLTSFYLDPLRDSVYGRNARYLSAWPDYFGKSSILFGRTVDIVCGTAHFLSQGSVIQTGRFLRSHILSFRGIKELITDNMRAVSALGLGRTLIKSTVNPITIWHWVRNLVKKHSPATPGFRLVLHLSGKDQDASSLAQPIGGFIGRISAALSRGLGIVYANDARPMRDKLSSAMTIMLRGLRLSDLFVMPVFGVLLFFIAVGTALIDAFRFYILKRPVEDFLRSPVPSYTESQRKARDLESVKMSTGLDVKLATNTYRVGTTSHIKTLWPESIPAQPEMAQVGLWWVCPARVYLYDAPLAGRGRVTVNFENCIKCESCWRAEPDRVNWGRHTDHKLIYRPESAAAAVLLDACRNHAKAIGQLVVKPYIVDDAPAPSDPETIALCHEAMNAARAFREAVSKLPDSADSSRRTWPAALSRRLSEKLIKLENAISQSGMDVVMNDLAADRKAFEQRIEEGSFFHALYCSLALEERLRSWITPYDKESPRLKKKTGTAAAKSYDEVSKIFPDRVVKAWEESPIPPEWAEALRTYIIEHVHPSRPALRALSAVSPALGLAAAHQIQAAKILTRAEKKPEPGICALNANQLDIQENGDSYIIKGTISLAPLAAAHSLLLIAKGKGFIVRIDTPGVTIHATPAIGFRASGLARVELDCTIRKNEAIPASDAAVPDPYAYLSIALGAGDYLCRRIKEHAAGRVQFTGQMLDTEGRDGIAKLGAVKAMIARTEAWRFLLESLYHSAQDTARSGEAERDLGLLCSAIAAAAFGPERGAMSYDAGQVFGGFAYSEDDLLSRFYRDSSLFRFIIPGFGASNRLHAAVTGKDLEHALADVLAPLDAIKGEPLKKSAVRWREIKERAERLPAKADPGPAGEAEAIILGTRGLLINVEHGLDQGRSMEAEAAAIEVLLGLAENALLKAEISSGRDRIASTAVFPLEPIGHPVNMGMDYETFSTGRGQGKPYNSGSFLETPIDASPRFTPEMQLFDAGLRARWEELAAWFKKNCREREFDGLNIERYIEKVHSLPQDIIDAVKTNKWLATYIPKSEDGLGWRKAEYYILNSVAGSFGDAAIDLLIMASTSIGTTPILLGLEDELPRVREELLPLLEDPGRLGEINKRLKGIVRSFANPNPTWIRKEYEALMRIVDDRARRTRVVKYLGANFLRAFYGAGSAGRRGDFRVFMSSLTKSGELFDQLMPDIKSAMEELPRRERCHRLHLRYLGHKGVSAFALTEPTAGSDSGGVKTTAHLERVDLTPLPDGRYAFHPAEEEGTTKRYLIDSDNIVFTDNGMAYRTPDGAIARIRYERYDYSTDQGARYYLHQNNECPFHDIGQVRKSGSDLIYEYYSLMGAKMWITNGSIATQFCLFAQTAEGVTGFMVDRHAEGLEVGADESKTGQRGSPTNELSLDRVRVPREAVIGYEGHGQVNALETLNVGRCGLAVISGALMRKLLDEARRSLPVSQERDQLLGEAAAVLFGSESLAYHLIGLFERPHESVRMESAIAKFSCSDDIHEFLTLIEYAYGPAGQTEQFLLEKARRDSRILTIYEGTNEVQRFLILKDLIAQAAAWPELPDHDSEDELARWKKRLRKHVKEAASLIGDVAWSDAMLQPAMFILSDMAAEILRVECMAYRCEWIREKSALIEQGLPGYASPMLETGMRAKDRALLKLEAFDRIYSFAWERIRNNMSVPEVLAADAALDRAAEPSALADEAPGGLTVPLRVLSIIRPVANISPTPRLSNGSIQEIVWEPEPLDRAGLAAALALKQTSPQISLDLLCAGSMEREDVIRSCAGPAVNKLYRIDANETAKPEMFSEAVRTLEVSGKYDLIIAGAGCSSGGPNLASYIAGSFGRPYSSVARISTKLNGTGFMDVPLSCVVGINASGVKPEASVFDLVQASFSSINILESIKGRNAVVRFERPSAVAEETKVITNTRDAAEYLKAYAAGAIAAHAEAYQGEIKPGALPNEKTVWAFLEPASQKSNVVVLRACRFAADRTGRAARALVAAPRSDWPALLGLAKANGLEWVCCVDTGAGMLSQEGRRETISVVMKASEEPVIAAGTDWNEAFAFAAGQSQGSNKDVRIFAGVTRLTKEGTGSLILSSPAYDGKLVRTEVFERGVAFISFLEEAEFPVAMPKDKFTATAVEITFKPEWIIPLPPPSKPSLSQADVIIDLGYGIRDQRGLDLALELKKRLEALGFSPMFGATRKVTQDLKLLPLDAQIGQTGVRVNPKLIIALGISGAPQHIDYIGTRAEIFCFNKDTEAPLMKLNRTNPAPRVHPIAGDLFVTVRELLNRF